MEIDAAIIGLGEKLDAWWAGFCPMLDSGDHAAQIHALLRGFELAKELDRLKAQGLSALAALLNRQDAITQEERTTSLIRGFEFGARLADTLHDEFRDTDGETEVLCLMDAMVKDLDAIGFGRVALKVLLDNPDAGVRASTGAYLIDLMPERIVPMLRHIDQTKDGNSAHFTAKWAVLAWEREGKSRFNYLAESATKPGPD